MVGMAAMMVIYLKQKEIQYPKVLTSESFVSRYSQGSDRPMHSVPRALVISRTLEDRF